MSNPHVHGPRLAASHLISFLTPILTVGSLPSLPSPPVSAGEEASASGHGLAVESGVIHDSENTQLVRNIPPHGATAEPVIVPPSEAKPS